MFLFVSGHNGLEVDHSRPRGLVVESLRASQPRRIVLELDWYVSLPFKMTPLLKFQGGFRLTTVPSGFSLTI